MASLCPFAKVSRPQDASACPFAKVSRPQDASGVKPGDDLSKNEPEHENKAKEESVDSPTVSPKCPFGYDSQTFKLGPFSCLICQALLFECSKCVPCTHVFCKACITRFNDCPLCGAEIEKIEADTSLQSKVDRFVDGHARIKRTHVNTDSGEEVGKNTKVIYEDVSLERGAFLVQQAMRAFRANNMESAKSRLSVCAEDIREQIERMGSTPELCSQLGAVLGMLGDCCRAVKESDSAINYFEESVTFLSKLPSDDLEISHTLSISLNKIGDLKYYAGDLQAARSYYYRALNVRRDVIKHSSNIPSQNLDVAVSLAKVADVDRTLGNEHVAVDGFQEAIKLLESLSINPKEAALEQKRASVLEFLNSQLADKQPENNP